jgi:hypothetical protein
MGQPQPAPRVSQLVHAASLAGLQRADLVLQHRKIDLGLCLRARRGGQLFLARVQLGNLRARECALLVQRSHCGVAFGGRAVCRSLKFAHGCLCATQALRKVVAALHRGGVHRLQPFEFYPAPNERREPNAKNEQRTLGPPIDIGTQTLDIKSLAFGLCFKLCKTSQSGCQATTRQ